MGQAAAMWVMAGISAAGTAYSVASSEAQARYQSAIAARNAELVRRQAASARDAGEAAAVAKAAEVSRLEGRQRAALAASGIDMQSGTALNLLGDTAAMGSTDVRTVQYNATLQAMGLDAQAGNVEAQGRLDAWASRRQGVASAVQGAANLYSLIPQSKPANTLNTNKLLQKPDVNLADSSLYRPLRRYSYFQGA